MNATPRFQYKPGDFYNPLEPIKLRGYARCRLVANELSSDQADLERRNGIRLNRAPLKSPYCSRSACATLSRSASSSAAPPGGAFVITRDIPRSISKADAYVFTRSIRGNFKPS
jgi:hypothetical protein